MLARSFLTLLITCVAAMLVMPGRTFAATPDTVTPVPNLALAGVAGIASDTSGNLYIADTANNQIAVVTPSGAITRYGSGTAGFTPITDTTVIGDAAVQFNGPVGIATDLNGNVYVADTGNNRIHLIVAGTTTKLINAASRIVTVAGSGIGGFSGDGTSSAVGARLNGPTGVAVDASGNIYIADNGNYRIRKVPVTVATDKTSGLSTYTPGVISTIAGDGTATQLTAYGIALSPAGDLYIADAGNNRILKMTAAQGVPSVFAGNGIAGFSGDGGFASLAQLNQPSGVVTNGEFIYIADTMNSCVRRVSHATNVMSTRLGPDENFAAIKAPVDFANPVSIAVDAAGTLYVGDTGNRVIQQIFASISAITTAKPPGGSYPTAQSVVLTSQKAATIYYTTDGTAPSNMSTPYTAAIPISATTTLRFTSIDFSGNHEVINSATYTIDTTAPSTSITINATPVNEVYYSALSTLAVGFTSNEPNTSIYYSTDGTVPTTAAAKYTIPVSIPVTATLTATNVQFFGVDAAGLKGNLLSQKYQIIALATTASPAGGVYSASKNVTLTSNNPSAAIYYTLDGTDPTTASAVYAGPVVIAANSTLKYRAKDADGNLEQSKSQVYTVDSILPTLSVSPVGGTFGVPQTVTLTSDKQNVTIYYTTTGISPTTSSSKYNVPLAITKTTTLMYFAVDAAGNRGNVGVQTYIIDSVAPITTASVSSGLYSSSQLVTLTTDDTSATTYYTTDGSNPTLLSTKYTAPIFIIATAALKYFSIDPIGNLELVKTQLYTIDAVPPNLSVSPVGGTFSISKTVTLTSDKPNVTIYYTTTGLSPTTSSPKYSAPLAIAKTTTLMYFGVDAAGNKSAFGAQTYIIDSVAPITTASLAAGSYSSTQSVILTTDDASATTYYTSDGSTPTLSSTPYTVPIAITATTTLKYFSIDPIGNLEQIKTQLYTIDAVTPNVSVSLVGGTYSIPQTVTFTSSKPNVTIYYTTTGISPTTSSSKYSAPLAIAKTTTLMYFGVDAAGNKSAFGAQAYIIDSVAPITTVSLATGSYSSPQLVIFTTDDASATTYYTTDGSTPTLSSTPYTVPIAITATTTLKYFSIDPIGNLEQIKTQLYTIDTVPPNLTISPVGGTFSIPQTVTLSPSKSNVTIYYSTTGISPTTSSSKYSAPLAIAKTTALMYFGVDAAGNRSAVGAQTYIIDSVAPITTASLATGSYPSSQLVILTTDDASATTYYTTDGSTPTLSSTPYAVPIAITATTTLKYFSIDPIGNLEQIKTQLYTIDSIVPNVSVSLVGGTFSIPQTVTLTSDKPNVTIYYTTTGISPTTSSSKYSVPLAITKTTTLMYFGVDAAGNKSAFGAQTYIIDSVAPITTASLAAGSYSSPQSVALSTDDVTATTYYTSDGSTPTLSSTPYAVPIAITATTTLKYFSIDPIGNLEQIKTQLYTIDAIAPNVSVSLAGGTFRTPQTVVLTSDEPNTVIYYTTTGISPTNSSSKYSAPLAVTKNTTLMYFGVDAAGNKSAVGAQTYLIDTVAPITTASVPSGTYSSIQSVTLTTDDPTATIYFTIDGSTPTDASTKYTAPILISGPTVLKYFAKDVSGNPESVKNGVYTINTLTTSASPKGGLFSTPQTVTLSSNNPGATIYYTTDGTAPSTDTNVSKTTLKYSKPLLLQGYKTTLKFFSVDALGVVENIKTEEYVINSLVTTVSPKGGMFKSPLAVTLKSSNTGATIYYTLDGTTPSNDAKLSKTTQIFTAPLYVQNGKTTLKFFSLDAQGVSENINTEIYTVDSTPPATTAKCGVTANSIELSATDSDDLLPEILYNTSNSASVTGTPFIFYTAPITFTLNTIVKFFAVDSAGNVEQIKTASCPAVVAPLDLKPALYLETAGDGSTTSNGSLYIGGNVAPTATITVNGSAATTNADGSFSHKIQLSIGENTITTVATKDAHSSRNTRIVNYVMPGPQAHDPLIAIGTGNGVIGNRVRVPITLTSGYQTSTVSMDLDTTTFSGVLSTPTVEIAQRAAARGKFIQIAPPSEGVYKIVITDINQPTDGVTKRAPLPEGVIAYLTLSVISPISVDVPLTVIESSVTDLDAAVMTVNAVTQGAVHVVSKPGNTWNTDANTEVAATLRDVLGALYMLIDPVTYPVSGSADLDADGRVQINELQQVINSLIGL